MLDLLILQRDLRQYVWRTLPFPVGVYMLAAIHDGDLDLDPNLAWGALAATNLPALVWIVQQVINDGDDDRAVGMVIFAAGCVWTTFWAILGLGETAGASYALLFLPLMLLLLPGLLGAAMFAKEELSDAKERAPFALLVAALLLQFVLVLLKLDGAVDWPWRLALIPWWCVAAAPTLGGLALPVLAVVDDDFDPPAVVLMWALAVVLVPLAPFTIMLAVAEEQTADDAHRLSQLEVVSPFLLAWALPALLAAAAEVLNCRRGATRFARAVHSRQETARQARSELRARRVDPSASATRESVDGAEVAVEVDVESPDAALAGEAQADELLSAYRAALLSAQAAAHGDAVQAALGRLRALLREHKQLRRREIREEITGVMNAKREDLGDAWGPAVAAEYGRVLRELSTIRNLVRTMSSRRRLE